MEAFFQKVIAIITTLITLFGSVSLPSLCPKEIHRSFSDDFSADNSYYCATAGYKIEKGRIQIDAKPENIVCLKDYEWCEATYEFDMNFKNVPEWAGVQFNLQNPTDNRDTSGYLFYVRESGNCRIYKAGTGVIAKGYVPTVDKKIHVKIVTEIGSIKVYIDYSPVPVLIAEDDTYCSGYFAFTGINGSEAYFDNLEITEYKTECTVKKVEIIENCISVNQNEELKLNAKVYPLHTENPDLKWSVTDLYGSGTDLATITDDGVLKANSLYGAVKVNVCYGEDESICDSTDIIINNVKSNIAPDENVRTEKISVYAEKNARIMAIGKSLQMNCSFYPTNAGDRDIEWSVTGTDNKETNLAVIDENGLLTALGDGTVKVTAKIRGTDIFATWVMTIGRITTNGIDNIKSMKFAFFAHYVNELTCDENGNIARDVNDLANTFNAEAFADEMARMGVQYVVFTAWHFRMIALYPSQVMKNWGMDNHCTERDLIGDMIDAVQEKGINVVLYTHAYDGYDFATVEEAQKTGWGNTTIYPYPDKESFDFEKWNKFINEVYGELMDRYGDRIMGVWSDEGNNQPDGMTASVDFTALKNNLLSKNDKLITFQNVYYNQYGMDIAIKECWHWAEFANPDASVWPAYKNKVPAIVFGSNWWSQGGNEKNTVTYSAEDIYRYQVLQSAVGSTGGGIQWASGPLYSKDGGFQNGVSETMEIVNQYLNPVSWTVKNTLPSTSYITEDGATNGTVECFVATQSLDGKKEYIHVLKPESSLIDGNELTLPLPADGKDFTKAVLAIDGTELTLEKTSENIIIKLPENISWSSVDTVIELS